MQFPFKKLFLKTLGKIIPSDFFAKRFPVSVKAIFFIDNKIVLLKNERGEWDLPGGKLKRFEKITECLRREVKEELSVDIEVGDLRGALKINVADKIEVMILVYSCKTNANQVDLKLSEENFELALFPPEILPTKNLHIDYQSLIKEICFSTKTEKQPG